MGTLNQITIQLDKNNPNGLVCARARLVNELPPLLIPVRAPLRVPPPLKPKNCHRYKMAPLKPTEKTNQSPSHYTWRFVTTDKSTHTFTRIGLKCDKILKEGPY